MKIVKNQPLASTAMDTQGETKTKEELEELAQICGDRYPLGFDHDNLKGGDSYITNFRVVTVPEKNGEWMLIGDVYLAEGHSWDGRRGFSYSITKPHRMAKNGSQNAGCLYIPYPYYNNDEVVDEILDYNSSLAVGKWVKKNQDPNNTALLATLVLFAATPLWTNVFNEHIWPFLNKSIRKYLGGQLGRNPLELGFQVGTGPNRTNVLLIPDRSDIKASTRKPQIKAALKIAVEYLRSDAAHDGIKLIKLYYDKQTGRYVIFSVIQESGQQIHIIPTPPAGKMRGDIEQ